MSFESAFDPVYTFLSKEGTKVRYTCNLCKGKISAQTTSNFGLIRHLKSNHAQEDLDNFNEIVKKNKASSKAMTKSASSLKNFGFKKQSPEELKKHQACEVTQETVNTAVFQLIMGAALPLTFVRKPDFKDLIGKLQPGKTVMSYQTLRNKMNQNFSDLKENMRDCFAKVDYICTTQDLWSAGKRGWLGMTAHWLNEDLSRASCGLACEQVKTSPTFDVLAKEMHKIYVDFHIQNKVHDAVTDNGKNFVKAFTVFSEDPEQDQQEIEHICTYFKPNNNEEDFDEDEELEEHVHEDLTAIIMDNGNHELRPFLPSNHHRCASHTLNLVACKDTEAALKTLSYKRILRSTFAKCQGIWNKQNMSNNVALIIQRECGVYFKTPVVTRWNSMYDSLKRFQILLRKSGDNFHRLFDAVGLPYLTGDEIKFIDEYILVTRPLAAAIDYLQGEENMYLGHLLPTLQKLDQTLIRRLDQLTICKPLLKSIRAGITRRFGELYNNPNILLSTILHPERKDLETFDDHTKERAKRLLINEVETLMDEKIGETQIIMPEEVGDDNDNDLFLPKKRPRIGTDPTRMVEEYLRSDCYELQLLKTFPILEQLFRKYNTAIPSSAPVERMFSHGGRIFEKRRQGLNEEQFKMQLLLKMNQGFWKKT